MALIGLTGRAGSGKDTVATALRQAYGFRRVAFADPIREAAYAANPLIENQPYGAVIRRLAAIVDEKGWDEAKRLGDVRGFLQRLGVAMRDVTPGIWLDTAMQRVKDERRDGHWNVVITDVRFPDEVTAIRAAGGKIVRLQRGVDALDLGANAGHVSEDVDTLDVDGEVHNNQSPQIAAMRVILAVTQCNPLVMPSTRLDMQRYSVVSG